MPKAPLNTPPPKPAAMASNQEGLGLVFARKLRRVVVKTKMPKANKTYRDGRVFRTTVPT
jgi:hypothetical protein